ncbi:hypothetical protein LP52_23195 [Streptomonospora alba]|uniref:VOC domain-containing protein n=1 Tax=Streptomonospora alba TaxID=183763 RepID=A0A0C2FC49_9ACTN|nr:VOC family protein [Streptomonospora alba]KIH96729.1 hypothetical protein LP52_23195 [Streptomonospora alba]
MSIHPTLRYTDAESALAFLTGAFGLVPQHVAAAEDGSIAHAELSWEDGVVMLGTRSDPPGAFDTGHAVLYLPVDDVDAHHDRAAAAGAEIAVALTEQPYGSREYAARDREGNLWCFGTYRPTIENPS